MSRRRTSTTTRTSGPTIACVRESCGCCASCEWPEPRDVAALSPRDLIEARDHERMAGQAVDPHFKRDLRFHHISGNMRLPFENAQPRLVAPEFTLQREVVR